MKSVLLSVSALLVSIGLLLMGNGLQNTLLPLRAQLENFEPFTIGLMGSAYFLGFVAGCLLGPGLVRRVGHIRTFAALVAIVSAVTLAHALLVFPFSWIVFRILAGMCFAGMYLVIESWLNEKAENKTRGMIMAAYQMTSMFTIMLGQLLIIPFPPETTEVFLVASLILSLAAVPVALSVSPAPEPPKNAKLRLQNLYSTSPAGMIACTLVGAITGAFWMLGPAYAVRIGLNTDEAAIFMSIGVLAGALAQYPVGYFSDKMDRRLVIVSLSLASAFFGAGLAFWPNPSHLEAFLFVFFFGAACMSIYAVSVSHTFDHTSPSDRVETSSGVLLVNGLGAIAGPLMAATFTQYVGTGGTFLFITLVCLLLAGFVGFRIYVAPAAKSVDNTPTFTDTPGQLAPLRRWWGMKSVRLK